MMHYYTPNDSGMVKLFLVCLTNFLVITKEEKWITRIGQTVTYKTTKKNWNLSGVSGLKK
jgi:hypothetical protein